jgi:hypothetical protein
MQIPVQGTQDNGIPDNRPYTLLAVLFIYYHIFFFMSFPVYRYTIYLTLEL